MPTLTVPSTTVDLSRLPAPEVVEQLSFEVILAAMLAELQTRLPSFDATVESEPVLKLLEVAAYRELLLRQSFNDRARQVMVAYATGANLDQLAALVGVERLVIAEADPDADTAAVLEGDDALRERVVLAPEGFTSAGPELAYVYHAKSADAGVLDASATSPAPGEVLVSVLARTGDGSAAAPLLAAVAAVVTRSDVRPLGDAVTVQSAAIVPFAVAATIYTFAGPDSTLVVQAANAQLAAYLAESRRLGRDIPRSSLIARLSAPGVQRVELTAPLADVACDPTQAAFCTSVDLVHGGYAD